MIRNLEMDNKIAWAVGKDEANRFMRKIGKDKQAWTVDAYNIAVKERNRLMDAWYPGENKQEKGVGG